MGRAFEVRKNSMAKTQGAKAKLYAKYAKEIYVSAKSGGTDPNGNLNLRRLMDKALEVNGLDRPSADELEKNSDGTQADDSP